MTPSLSTLYFGGLYEVRGGVETLHLFAGNRRVASIRTDGKNQFYHTNHLGSTSFITDSIGDPKEQIEYHPFGTYRDVGSPTGTYDYDPDFPDVYYTYTGQEDDDELGLYNYGARLYDPVLGRFISPDSVVPDPGNPQALNRYTYSLNNPLIYTDPSGNVAIIDDILLGISIIVGSFMGAYQAKKAGKNPWAGAMLGAIIGTTSYMVGNVVGTAVTLWLTPTAQTAVSAATMSAAKYAGMYAGAFAGGATAGGLNAAAYGGNVWQGALYGGLTAVAIVGLVHGAIELNNWVNNWGNSNSSIVLKDPKTGKLISAEQAAYKEVVRILGITDKIKQIAEQWYQDNQFVKIFRPEDSGRAIAQQIEDVCAAGIGCHRAFDLRATAWKFDTNTLHIRSFGDIIAYHWDRFNLSVSFGSFVNHVGVDIFKNVYYAIRSEGIIGGLKEGL